MDTTPGKPVDKVKVQVGDKVMVRLGCKVWGQAVSRVRDQAWDQIGEGSERRQDD